MDHSNHRRHEHHIRKRVPAPQEVEGDGPGGTKTVVQVVYVTQDPISPGDAVGVKTIAPVVTVTAVAPPPPPKTTTPPRKQTVEPEDTEEEPSPSTTFKKTTKISPSTFAKATTSSKYSSPVASHTSIYHSSATAALGETPSPSSTSVSSASKPSGLGVGVYAGIIGGSVAVFLLVAAIIAIMVRKKQKSKNYTKPEDEKGLNRLSFNDRSPASPVPMPKPMTPAVAPKLSIRPMTQFDGAAFMSSSSPSNAEQSKAVDEKSAVRRPPPTLALNKEKTLGPGPFQTPEPSPAMSAFSDSSNMSLPIQGGTAPSPVHRIMTDFKPSMADELELRSGDLVRLLHEYDDGWALCVRMDRSQQGVCPRTCLSARAVKPRPPPGGGPPGAARGPPQPNAMRNAPPRPQSPGNRPPMSSKGMSGPPRGPKGPDSRPSSPAMNGRQPHPLSKVQREDDVQFHAM